MAERNLKGLQRNNSTILARNVNWYFDWQFAPSKLPDSNINLENCTGVN